MAHLRWSSGLAALLMGVAPVALTAQRGERADLVIAPQDLGSAIRAFAAATGRDVVASSEIVDGRRSGAVRSARTPEEAMAQMLSRTGLEFTVVDGTFVLRFPGASDIETPAAADREVVVTGTRIRGAGPVGSNVITIRREDIERTGFATTQQVLATLPQNFGGGAKEVATSFSYRNNTGTNIGAGASINLRGLGVTSTLVLVDGNRSALAAGNTFVDLSLIPTSAIERIEILADGASALYGSDAVAGVVNVRLRQDFRGAESGARIGFADGFKEVQFSQLLGGGWEGGKVTAAYEFYRRGRLSADDRTFATEDLRRWGGPDYRQGFSNPATIVAANGQVFGVPRGQDGRSLTAASLIPGVPNLSDARVGTDILPQSSRHAATIAVQQEFGASVTARVRGFFADRTSVQYFIPTYSAFSVTPANPFYVDPIGTRQSITVRYDFRRDLGPFTLASYVRNLGLTGAVEARRGAWTITAEGSYGTLRERNTAANSANSVRLAQALADTSRATAFDPFGDGSFTPAATLDRVRGGYENTGRSYVWSAALRADGALFALPAGDVRLALGGEYRHERATLAGVNDQTVANPTPNGTAGFPLQRSVRAVYAEAFVPVVSAEQGIAGISQLDLSIAGRVEDYSDVGRTANPRFGLRYRAVDGLTLRGTFGTSFRAPSFVDIRTGPGLSQVLPYPLADPASATGSTPVIALFGNDPDIGPEKARTWTLGIDAQPRFLTGLTLQASYFDIDYRDRIYNPGVDFLSFLSLRSRFASLITDNPSAAAVAALYASPLFSNPFGIPASSIRAVVDSRNANLARSTIRGIDFDLGYRQAREGRSVEIGVSGTRLLSIRQALTADSPVLQVVGTIGNPVKLRLRGRSVVTVGGFTLAGYLNHTAAYLNNAVVPTQRVAAWNTADVQAAYTIGTGTGALGGLRLALSVTNLLDADPPYVNNRTPLSASAFDPEQASPIGRLVALKVTKSW